MTPYLVRVAMPALLDRDNTLAWTQAAMTRAKKLPKLEKLMSKKQTGQIDIKEKMKMIFGKHNAGVKEKRHG